ncbi:MAG: NAD-dependent epimerase/dehydratase family protein [Bacteroidetes bacterium]|nr:NAD-dependent epimerase/dehydratase family protein [Bacteroidota bacterium]
MILVTGANGLVGSYLCRFLVNQGNQVRAIKRPESNLRLVADIANKIEWVDGDVNDISSLDDAMLGVEQIYHCAAVISYVGKNANHLMQVNVEGTANVVNLALDNNIKKLVHISSIAALGRTGKKDEIVTEATPWDRKNLTSDYSISKFLAEREVWRAMAEGLNAVIVNPSIIVGAGNWDSGSCKLFTTIYNGFKYYTNGVTGYVDVRDVLNLLPVNGKRNYR